MVSEAIDLRPQWHSLENLVPRNGDCRAGVVAAYRQQFMEEYVMSAVRQDVTTLGAGWNKVLLNYALAMRELDKMPISNRNSWKFLAAIHGFDAQWWTELGLLQVGERVPNDLLTNTYGNQCQHGSWYFLPWHRAYLFAFESIVAAKVKELTGDEWALPYWNYLDAGNPQARRVPDAFLAETLPNGDPNPLRKYPRRAGFSEIPSGPNRSFSLAAMEENDFLVGNDGTIGFGGGITGDFVQFGGWTGDLELNPHNTVHGMVGGDSGFMGNALLAGLDPIFWLHHCNVDRLWEAWMSAPGKTMVRDQRWLEGPADRRFIMPNVGGSDLGLYFSAKDTLRGGKLYRIYDDLTKGTGVTPGAEVMARVKMGFPASQSIEPIGANEEEVRVGDVPVRTLVILEPAAVSAGVASMGATEAGKQVSRLYLALESVRGKAPSPLLDVYINVPDGADPLGHPELLAGSLTLFGLNVASRPDGAHGGNGLSYTLDISDLAQRMADAGNFDPSQVRVTLVPGEQISEESAITVERISVLKRSGVVS